ncbi:TROVE domain-containing protein [Frankia sp. CN7]|uniref:TROVE domain-containing protein n=2 Tax=Frankia nepalensis TaxID=1836974 RepID=A0A937RQ36_9ACTN|nr:TROVE domain-containing protein [Frankia nepalensis]MBL7498898.1 TROVE domain-containing protein [Frankia nepalensis]MBL7512573.1 TROVE domain-containing protein [Frankia nepalensis]MBL7632854.1 TROVE domain-containing protein [Frankia nepalensis]
MGKLAKAMSKRGITGPVRTTGRRTVTAEGGAGWSRDVKGELFTLAVTNLVAEDTFYERGRDRDDRFVSLLWEAVAQDAGWVARFVPWLRDGANMRTASVVAAAEYARALAALPADARAAAPTARSVIAGALQRADEPGEFVAYWLAGRRPARNSLPGGVQRGVADAATRLFTERAALKYDGVAQAVRLGDVVELARPTPAAPWQNDLFRYLLDRRHHGDGVATENLPMLRARAQLEAVPAPRRGAELRAWGADAPRRLAEAGVTWEALAGWLGGPMDAVAWSAVVPSMGLMAAVRNLRNLDRAGVDDQVAEQVAARLADAAQVRASRMFPLRFLSAYKAAPSARWARPLEQAVGHSLANVPALPGRTLVLVDQSGSMAARLSARSDLTRAEAAALFGFAVGLRAEEADVYVYGADGGWKDMTPKHRQVRMPKGGSLLRLVEKHGRADLGGTLTWTTLRRTYHGHARVVIVTDEQAHDSPDNLPDVPIITFNVAGYRAAHVEAAPNRVTVGGLSDAGFTMLGHLDTRHRGGWPF